MWKCRPALVTGSRGRISPLLDFTSNSNIVTKLPEVLVCCWINLGWVVDEFQKLTACHIWARSARKSTAGPGRQWEELGLLVLE